MSECVQVVVRCRPLNDRELANNTEIILSVDPEEKQCILRSPGTNVAGPRKLFTFDNVYDTDSTNEDIYSDMVSPLVDSILGGYNGCVFAYGQTSCGKTFSMQGIPPPSAQQGIMSRAVEQIFESIQLRDVTYCVIKASYLEIYNEEIRDLLNKENINKLELKEHPEKGIYVKGISSVEVTTVEEMEEVMEVGSWNRALGATAINPDSSRSHCIFIIDFELCYTSEDEKEHFRSGRLNLVDLAGSERQRKAKAEGDRLKEATKINLSLSALGNVISALVDNKCKHIPYRASKLTRLLQDSLGGNSRTLMIACVSPGENNYSETLSTLRYANRAKNIRNRPRVNEDPKDVLIVQYQKEIKMLRQILSNQMKLSSPQEYPVLPLPASSLDSDKAACKPPFRSAVVISKQARLEYEQKISELQHRYDHEHISKEKLQTTLQSLKIEFDNYRLRSEYTLQRLQAENRLKIEALKLQVHGQSYDSHASSCSSLEDPFPCSSCEDLMTSWSEKSFESGEIAEVEKAAELGDHHRLWSCHWWRCKSATERNSNTGKENALQAEEVEETKTETPTCVDDSVLDTISDIQDEEEQITPCHDDDDDNNNNDNNNNNTNDNTITDLGDRESGDGVSDTSISSLDICKGAVITKEPKASPDVGEEVNEKQDPEKVTSAVGLCCILPCVSCFGENFSSILTSTSK